MASEKAKEAAAMSDDGPPPPLPPPPYSASSPPVSFPGAQHPASSAHPTSVPTPNLFPQTFGLYRDGLRDMYIALHSDSPPLFLIKFHHGVFSSKPDIVLTPCDPSPHAASFTTSANIKAFSSSTEVSIANGMTTTISKDGMIRPNFVFTLPGGAGMQYEWKHSSGPEVGSLAGRSGGMKLVRYGSGGREVIAAWTHPGFGAGSKKAKMIWCVEDRAPFGGPAFEMLAVMCMIVQLERERRSRAAGAGGGGGA